MPSPTSAPAQSSCNGNAPRRALPPPRKNAVEITGLNEGAGLPVYTSTQTNEGADRILANRSEIQFVMVWNDSGGFRRVSLRSRPNGCNVSAIANLHGGGGHRSASSSK